MEVFGRAVTEMRLAKDVSQVSLASALGYSGYYLGLLERGAANVTCEVMSAVSGYFGMSIGQFWTYAEGLPQQPAGRKRSR